MSGRRAPLALVAVCLLAQTLPSPAASASLALAAVGSITSLTSGDGVTLSAETPTGAMTIARRDGHLTEVTGLTTDRRRVTADPATGIFTETDNVWPVRALVDGVWVPLDPALAATGTSLAPRASSVGLTISGGGDGELVRLTEGTHSFAFTWPNPLPTPTIDDDKAVFSNVRPGIDLVVSARPTGFGEFLVVRDRAAAQDPWLSDARLGVDASGQTLEKDGDRLKARDASGALTFISEPVRMWDSGDKAVNTSGSALAAYAVGDMPMGHVAPVAFHLEGDRLVLTPNRSLLDSPDAHFPIVIDPSMAGARTRFASVDSSGKKGVYSATNKGETPWIGIKPISGAEYGGLVSRILYGFTVPSDLSKSGLKVISAKLRHWQVQSTETGTDCLKQTNAPYINAWETHDFSDDFVWHDQPTSVLKLSNSQFVVGNVDKCKAAGYTNHAAAQEWDVLTGVLDHIDDQDDILTFRINEEYDNNDDMSSSTRAKGTRYYQNSLDYPALVIEYNAAPQPPTVPVVSPATLYSGTTYVSSTTPVLSTTVRDSETTQDVTATFAVTTGTTTTSYKTAAVRGPGTTGAVARTGTGQVKVADGLSYTVSAKANDGVVDSTVGPSSSFVVDSTAPGLPAVTGAPSTTVAPGTPLTFTVDAPESDVASYGYGLNTNDPTAKTTPSALGGPVTVTVTARQFGPNFFAVRSYDRAGNSSTSVQKVAFKVDGSAPADRYRLDGSGADTRTDTAAGTSGSDLTVPAGTEFAAGRDRYGADGTTTLDCTDQALRVLSSSSVRSVTTPAPHPFDTSQAFTVSAWVKPETTAGTATGSGDEAYAISMPASASSTALSLGFRKDPASGQVYWLFTVTGAVARVDVEDATNRSAALVATNRWTHLSGVFDPGGLTATLYVDGTPVAQRTGLAIKPVKASQLQLGSGPLGTAALQFNGSVDEVLLYQGVLSSSAVNAQRSSRRTQTPC